jgi:hypothetical protein
MAVQARSLASPHAARDIVDLIAEAARRAVAASGQTSPKKLGRT